MMGYVGLLHDLYFDLEKIGKGAIIIYGWGLPELGGGNDFGAQL